MGNFISESLGGGSTRRAINKSTRAQTDMFNKSLAEMQRQFGISQGYLQPYLSAGSQALGNLGGGMDSLSDRLAMIMDSPQFDDLVGERMRGAQGMLGAGGLTRSGAALEEGARIPTDLAMQIEQMLYGRDANLATMGQNTAVGAGTNAMTQGTNLANLMGQQGQNIGNSIMAGNQAEMAGVQNLLNLGGMIGGSMLGSGALFGLSDPEAKENMIPIDKIGLLNVYTWDWKPELEGTMVSKFPTIGFSADEVEEHYPEYIGEFGGYKTINYSGLLEHLNG